MKIILLLIGLGVVVVGLIVAVAIGSSKSQNTAGDDNVVMIDGKQTVTIVAKGGYSPWNTTAKADTPTAIKIVTKGTFDCSAALVIPSLNYRKMLPQSGETLIEVSPQKTGTVLQGLCAMGMYSFTVKFS